MPASCRLINFGLAGPLPGSLLRHLHQVRLSRGAAYSARAERVERLAPAWNRALMHELGLAAEIHRIARGAADDHGGGALELVTVVIGELAAVEPDLLEFAWQAQVSGGQDAGSRLAVEWRRARQLCASCGEVPERAPGSWLRLCPRCEEPLSVHGGDELEVRTVSFSDLPVSAAGER